MPRESLDDAPENHLCENCGKRKAWGWWIGDGGSLAISRFHMQAAWCELCHVVAQLDYARERAAAIPELKRRLDVLQVGAT